MKKILLFILVLFSFFNVQAQSSIGDKVKEAQFEIVKATVEFLSTDKQFGNSNDTSCKNCNKGNYECLQDFATKRTLKGVGNIITHFGNKNITLDSLLIFKKNIVEKITVGDEKKKKRLSQPNYPAFERKLNGILSNLNIIPNPKPKIDSIPHPVPPPPPVIANESSFNFLNWLPYIIIVLIIGLFILILSKSFKENEKLLRKLKDSDHTSKYQVENAKSQISELTNELKQAKEEVETLQNSLAAEKKKNQNPPPNTQSNIEYIKKDFVDQPKKQESPIKYARYADQGDGFSISELLTEEDNETIFEIKVLSANTASFKVTNNLNAQKYALSNAAYFLGKTCKYDTTPSSNSIIRTDTNGELKLQGSKWIIQSLAKISFT